MMEGRVMEQNQPVGVPSGWEEIAAHMEADVPAVRSYWWRHEFWRVAETFSNLYSTGPHDWRILP